MCLVQLTWEMKPSALQPEKFDCVKISYLQRTKIVLKTTTLRVTEWYAKGVGLVKSEAYDTKGNWDSKTLLVKIVKK